MNLWQHMSPLREYFTGLPIWGKDMSICMINIFIIVFLKHMFISVWLSKGGDGVHPITCSETNYLNSSCVSQSLVILSTWCYCVIPAGFSGSCSTVWLSGKMKNGTVPPLIFSFFKVAQLYMFVLPNIDCASCCSVAHLYQAVVNK